jgi:CRP/FNR family cyclic AMP-dependent transcriptional regulator
MKRKNKIISRLGGFSSGTSLGGKVSRHRKKQNIYTQGDPAYTLFYIQEGGVRLTARTKHQAAAVTAILGVNDFFGELCLAGVSPSYVHGRRVDRQLHKNHQKRKDASNASQKE